LPSDIAVVVGIPRSGLMIANLIALHLQRPLAELNGFARGELLHKGRRLSVHADPSRFRKALIVDDSFSSGSEPHKAQAKLKGVSAQVLYAVGYATPEALRMIDFAFEALTQPRFFERNLMSGEVIRNACADIDGVLCPDHTNAENDDGPRYLKFITEAPLRHRPHARIRHLGRSRLERYRPETMQWLATNGIEFERLWMARYAKAAERRAAQAYARLKANVYLETGSRVFIESSDKVARQIAELAQRPVFCTDSWMIYPGQPPGAIMTFPGRSPPGIKVPLLWFVRQAGIEAAHRVRRRLRNPFGRTRQPTADGSGGARYRGAGSGLRRFFAARSVAAVAVRPIAVVAARFPGLALVQHQPERLVLV
jgi:uncharacterized HAD superfamily protein